MKVLYWTVKFSDDNKMTITRKTTEVLSLKDFAIKYLDDMFVKLFTDTPVCHIEISKDTEQIRIPKLEYEQLKPQIKDVLKRSSVHRKNDEYYKHEPMDKIYKEWVETNYWSNCKAYIFDYDTYKISALKSEEDDYDDREEVNFMQSIHPFIDEFINCNENRWGESGEIANIKKWKA